MLLCLFHSFYLESVCNIISYYLYVVLICALNFLISLSLSIAVLLILLLSTSILLMRFAEIGGAHTCTVKSVGFGFGLAAAATAVVGKRWPVGRVVVVGGQ